MYDELVSSSPLHYPVVSIRAQISSEIKQWTDQQAPRTYMHAGVKAAIQTDRQTDRQTAGERPDMGVAQSFSIGQLIDPPADAPGGDRLATPQGPAPGLHRPMLPFIVY